MPATTFAPHIARLVRLLTTSRDLSEPWDHFHEHLASHPEFGQLGIEANNPIIESVLKATLHRSRLPPSGVSVHVPEHGLWHGFVHEPGLFVVFFYAEAERTGLLGVMRSPSDPQTVMVRFTAREHMEGSFVAPRGAVA